MTDEPLSPAALVELAKARHAEQIQQDAERAIKAERLLNDDMLKGAFDALEADYLKAWRETKYNDTDGRERLWQAVQIVGKVKSHLQHVVSAGRLAKAEIEQMRQGGRRGFFG
jgi:hypothetical protein